MFNLCFPFIPSLFYIVLNDDYMLCKVTLGVLKGASKLNVLLLLLLSLGDQTSQFCGDSRDFESCVPTKACRHAKMSNHYEMSPVVSDYIANVVLL